MNDNTYLAIAATVHGDTVHLPTTGTYGARGPAIPASFWIGNSNRAILENALKDDAQFAVFWGSEKPREFPVHHYFDALNNINLSDGTGWVRTVQGIRSMRSAWVEAWNGCGVGICAGDHTIFRYMNHCILRDFAVLIGPWCQDVKWEDVSVFGEQVRYPMVWNLDAKTVCFFGRCATEHIRSSIWLNYYWGNKAEYSRQLGKKVGLTSHAVEAWLHENWDKI